MYREDFVSKESLISTLEEYKAKDIVTIEPLRKEWMNIKIIGPAEEIINLIRSGKLKLESGDM